MKTIDQILKDARTVAIVGLSPKPERASIGVATYLQEQGYRVQLGQFCPAPLTPRNLMLLAERG